MKIAMIQYSSSGGQDSGGKEFCCHLVAPNVVAGFHAALHGSFVVCIAKRWLGSDCRCVINPDLLEEGREVCDGCIHVVPCD